MTLHDSERVVGRVRKDGGWDRRYGPRSQARRDDVPDFGIQWAYTNPDGSSLIELAVGVLVLLSWFVALFWALPVIVLAVMS